MRRGVYTYSSPLLLRPPLDVHEEYLGQDRRASTASRGLQPSLRVQIKKTIPVHSASGHKIPVHEKL